MQALPETGFLRINQVLNFVPIGKSTLWAWIRAGKFPKPIKLAEKTSVWRAEDIRSYLANPGGGPKTQETPIGSSR